MFSPFFPETVAEVTRCAKRTEIKSEHIHINVRNWVAARTTDFPPLAVVMDAQFWTLSTYEKLRAYLLEPPAAVTEVADSATKYFAEHANRKLWVTGVGSGMDADTRQTHYCAIIILLAGAPPPLPLSSSP